MDCLLPNAEDVHELKSLHTVSEGRMSHLPRAQCYSVYFTLVQGYLLYNHVWTLRVKEGGWHLLEGGVFLGTKIQTEFSQSRVY